MDILEALKRTWERFTRKNDHKKECYHDSIILGLLLEERIKQLKTLMEGIKYKAPDLYMNLCPKCAGYTWGRGGRDFTKRICHECGHIRDEPQDEECNGPNCSYPDGCNLCNPNIN